MAGDGRDKIARACAATRDALGATGADWLTGYYQMANRLAFLHFLQGQGVPARLLFVYFVGDRQDRGVIAPQTEAEWLSTLGAQNAHQGIPAQHLLHDRVHKIFLAVRPLLPSESTTR